MQATKICLITGIIVLVSSVQVCQRDTNENTVVHYPEKCKSGGHQIKVLCNFQQDSGRQEAHYFQDILTVTAVHLRQVDLFGSIHICSIQYLWASIREPDPALAFRQPRFSWQDFMRSVEYPDLEGKVWKDYEHDMTKQDRRLCYVKEGTLTSAHAFFSSST